MFETRDISRYFNQTVISIKLSLESIVTISNSQTIKIQITVKIDKKKHENL